MWLKILLRGMEKEEHHIAVSDFKARCLGLFGRCRPEKTYADHHEIRKTDRRVMPIENTKPPLLGGWEGVVEVEGDIVNFDTSSEWAAADE